MSDTFQSNRHEKAFRAVLNCLRRIGYAGELVQEHYIFNDWFLPSAPKREVCAVFGQTPFSYDSACFAVFPTTTVARSSLVTNYRSLGAPFAFEVREEGMTPWRVGHDVATTGPTGGCIPPEAIEAAFKRRESDWSPQAVLRAKNIGLPIGQRQLDFIDFGLIPALESEISGKIHQLLNEALAAAQGVYAKRTSEKPDVRQLFRLVFRFLAGKVLHDRGAPGFRNLTSAPTASEVLKRVGEYYGETLPVLQDGAAQQAALECLWCGFSFQNLSVDILAHVYENTLVDPGTREKLGIHSTPRSIARYIVNRLPFEEIPQDERVVVEPCSGHGVFLVSALKRLRNLLPPDMDGQSRHRYFVRMLRGFEIDPFALEVSRLCLTLADFPNHNGWRIEPANVFASAAFERALQQARVVLCNPPFEDFELTDSARSEGITQQPVLVLKKVLAQLHSDGLLGFVLPRQFISGRAYQEIRRILARRFDEIEVVALPDRMFRHALLETCLLLGRAPRKTRKPVAISFSEVKDNDRDAFLSEYAVSRRDSANKTEDEAESSLGVLPLNEIWERLNSLPCIGDIADVHRGLEWQQPFDEKKYLSPSPKPGFVRGVNSAEGHFLCFQKPEAIYLCAKPETRRRHAWDLPWEKPKVVMNAVRVSRGPWKIAAFVEETETRYTANFTCLWPKDPWTPKTLAAVLNSPLAAAFVTAKETAKHILKSTLEALPIPRELSPEQTRTIEALVDDYVAAIQNNNSAGLELWGASEGGSKPRRILTQIDAEILRAYNLPPRLERQLLDFFHSEKRPVPFQFKEYFPLDFTPTIPLWRYLTYDFARCNGRYLVAETPKLTDPALLAVFEEIE